MTDVHATNYAQFRAEVDLKTAGIHLEMGRRESITCRMLVGGAILAAFITANHLIIQYWSYQNRAEVIEAKR